MDKEKTINCELKKWNESDLEVKWESTRDLIAPKLYWRKKSDLKYSEITPVRCEDNAIIFRNPSPSTRNFYKLQDRTGITLHVAQREITLQGVDNIRDLGGYKTLDSKRVKWGMIYRSAELKDLRQEDMEHFQSLGIRTICDLRSGWEIGALNTEVMSDYRYFNFPLNIAEKDLFHPDLLKDLEKVREFSLSSYRNYVMNPNIEKFFKVFLEEDNFPLLIHCVGGKDRTGFICAIILLVLGVPRETVIEDYLLSKEYIDRLLKKAMAEETHYPYDASIKKENVDAFMYPQKDYMNAALDEIIKEYGDFINYFDYLGLNKERRKALCERFLE